MIGPHAAAFGKRPKASKQFRVATQFSASFIFCGKDGQAETSD
jgi:hypothetical protein